jgi:hypothetical protein
MHSNLPPFAKSVNILRAKVVEEHAAKPLECGDSSPLSAGDLSPSNWIVLPPFEVKMGSAFLTRRSARRCLADPSSVALLRRVDKSAKQEKRRRVAALQSAGCARFPASVKLTRAGAF